MPRLSHMLETSLYVADLDRAVTFYRRIFNFEPFLQDDRMIGLGVPGGSILLLSGVVAPWRPPRHRAAISRHMMLMGSSISPSPSPSANSMPGKIIWRRRMWHSNLASPGHAAV